METSLQRNATPESISIIITQSWRKLKSADANLKQCGKWWRNIAHRRID